MNATTRACRDAFAVLDHVHCEYCGTEVHQDVPINAPDRAVGDHRIPRARGGTNTRANIAITCNRCNQRKAMLTEHEYRTLIHDTAAIHALRKSIHAALNPEVRTYESREDREEARRARQAQRLEGRRQPPNPRCTTCAGHGIVQHRVGRDDPCRCTIRDPRGRAA